MGLSAVCDCGTYYFWVSLMRTAMALATFAWSSLSLRHSLKFSRGDSNGDWMPFCASSEGSGESAHLHRLTLAFVTVQNILCYLKWRFVCYSCQQRIPWWVCIFAKAKSLDNVINIKISCAGSKGSWEYARLHRLAWAFYTVSNYHVLVEMAIFATFMWTTNDVVSLHQHPPSVRCINASKMLPVRCNKNSSIKHLLVYQEKKTQSSNRFWMLFHGNMTTAALRHADFTQFRQLH